MKNMRGPYGPEIISKQDHQNRLLLAYMQRDVKEFVEWCNKCQRFENVQCVPREKMTAITSPWPFA